MSIVITPPRAVANQLQDIAVVPSWRLPGFIALSLVFHLAIVMSFLHAKPESSLLMAGREGGVVAMTLLSVAESQLAASTAAPATMATPAPESQPQAAAALANVPDAVIPLQSAVPQRNQRPHTDNTLTPSRTQKSVRVKPQSDERPVRQEKHMTPAAVTAERPASVSKTTNTSVVKPNEGPETQNNGTQAAQTSAVKQVTSSTPAEKTGSVNSGNAVQGAGSSNNQNFKALHRRVNYPQRAKALGVEGRVRIKFDVTASGTVTNIRILSETPSGVFAAAIQPDITRWRYQTQQAVSDQVVSIVFKLNGQVQLEN